MSAKEGINRIAKAISVVSWIALCGGLLTTVSLSMMARRDVGIVFFVGLLASVSTWALAQGLVWIIDGFAGNKDESSSLLWPIKKKNRTSSQTAIENIAVSPPLPKSREDLYGVGGWLVFFLITLAVVTPITVLGGTALNISETERLYPGIINHAPWKNYKIVTWAAALTAAGSYCWCGWVMRKQHIPSSVNTAIICMWVVPISVLCVDVIAADYFLKITPTEMLGSEALASLVKVFIYATIWTLYLKLSKRVRNTYKPFVR